MSEHAICAKALSCCTWRVFQNVGWDAAFNDMKKMRTSMLVWNCGNVANGKQKPCPASLGNVGLRVMSKDTTTRIKWDLNHQPFHYSTTHSRPSTTLTPSVEWSEPEGWVVASWSDWGQRWGQRCCHGSDSISTVVGDDVFLRSFSFVSFGAHTLTHVCKCDDGDDWMNRAWPFTDVRRQHFWPSFPTQNDVL